MEDIKPPEINSGAIPLKSQDESLMRDFASGSQEAFELIFERYSSHIINFAYRFLGTREEAEDIAQEVFLRIYRAKEQYDANRPFRPWIFSITSRLISNRLRDRKRHPTASLDWNVEDDEGSSQALQIPEKPGHEPAQILGKKQLVLTVRRALEQLPENQRTAVILARFEEMSYEEIAQAMNTSVLAVKSLLFRARESLKKLLGKIGD